ncbi:MAG TPA: Ig-like domain repeat protein [Terracidiphilus sp.]
MKLARLLCWICAAALAVAGSIAHPQAAVVENESAALYVDAQSGSDSNSGSSASPLKTIQAAVNKANANNQKSIGTKIVVNAGVYREIVNIDSVSGMTSAPLTVVAATNAAAIVSASDILSGWSPDPQYSGAFVTNWSSAEDTCALPTGWPAVQEIALHTEMIFVNGIPMTQVLVHSDLKPGTFFVNTADGTLHVFPANGVDPGNATVEAASRAKTLSVIGRTNIVVRGLVFEHAANCVNTSAATVTNSKNVLIDAIETNWNNWGGLNIASSSNVTVQNSISSYNGGIGFQATKDQTILLTNNETDYNNWRGAQAAFYNWGMGGAKLFQMRSTTVQNHFSYNNQAQGLWFDTDNQNITINHATLVGSYNAALQLERNEGPVTLENSYLCSSGVGVNVLTTKGLTVNNNVFYNNGATNKYQAQFYLAGSTGGINITNWLTGQVYDLITTGTVLSGNSFIDKTNGQFVFGTYLSGSDWTDFTNTLKSDGNTWFDPNTATAFRLPNGKNVNLAGWQTATGTDYGSAWAAPATSPAFACTPPTAAYPDFNVSLDNGAYTMSSGSATATVRVDSFNFGTVNLNVSGLPAGVTASFSTSSLVSGVSNLVLSSSSTSVARTVPVTLWAISGDRVHSATFNLTVSPNPGVISTTTSLVASASSIGQNSPVTLNATVKPASGSVSPTGTVTFYSEGTVLGTATLSTGAASLTTSALPVGANSITASYAGAGAFSPSTSSAVNVTVKASTAGTTTTLSTSASSITQGSTITLRAAVQSSSASSSIPTGTVTFYNGSAIIGSASLSGGAAVVSTSNLPAGPNAITATYSGATAFSSSTSNAITIQVNAAVVSTATSLAASSTTVTQGSAVNLTATVKQSSGTTAPTGTVSFYNGTTLLGSASLSGGIASISTSSLPTGTDSISAAYSGAVTFNASSSSVVAITVNPVAPTAVNTTTTLVSSAISILQNSSVTFVATIKPASGTAAPTGTISFLNGTVVLGSSALVSGVATFTTSALSVGTSAISARYAGTSSFSPSTSNAVSVVVKPAVVTTTTQLIPSSINTTQDSPVTLTATVSGPSGSSTPTGTVTFYNGVASIGTAQLTSGTATLSTSSLPVGTDAITAAYAGTSTFNPSKSSAVSITVAAAMVDTTTSVSASTNSTDVNSMVSLQASVKAARGTAIPTGTVTFFDGTASLGTANLSGGVASVSTTALSEGQHSISAIYLGTSAFLKSTSNSVSISVVSAPVAALVSTSTAVSSSTSQADQGYTISLTASVIAVSGTAYPTGPVVFSVGTQNIGVANLVNGRAYLNTSELPVGNDVITARYSGNQSFAPSTSSTIQVIVSGPDFTVNATPSTVSTTPGNSAHIALVITPKNGFDQVPQLTCSGLPAGVTCSFATPTKQSDGTSLVNLTIQTTSESSDARGPRSTKGASGAPIAFALLPLLLCLSSRRRKEFHRLASLSLLALAIILGGSVIGCGGKAGANSTTVPSGSTTHITVTAQVTGLSHTADIQLTLR